MTKKSQRIKLQVDGSPVKLDADILSISPDATQLKVRFDAPLDDAVLYAWGNFLIDRKLDPATESPSQYPNLRIFKVVG